MPSTLTGPFCPPHLHFPTGYGYNGRVSQRCDQGTYNPGDTYGTCTPCPFGLTTSAVGAGVTVADCGVAGGFGNFSGTIAPCPIGTYNGKNWTAAPSPQGCTDCPGFTTTAAEGAASVDQCSRKYRLPFCHVCMSPVMSCPGCTSVWMQAIPDMQPRTCCTSITTFVN